MNRQMTFLAFFFCSILISCSIKVPNKITVAERMGNGTYIKKEIVNKDSIKQIMGLLNERTREDRVKFYMQYNLQLIYSSKRVNYSIGGKYLKDEDGKAYKLTQHDSLLKMLSVSK